MRQIIVQLRSLASAETYSRGLDKVSYVKAMDHSLERSSDAIAALYFPRAAQSDILRAAQKDELCLRAFESSIREVVYGYLGAASLHKYGDAIRALATTAYYATSVGTYQYSLCM